MKHRNSHRIFKRNALLVDFSLRDAISAFFFFSGSIWKQSQKRNVSSAPTDATVVPSGLITRPNTRAVCPEQALNQFINRNTQLFYNKFKWNTCQFSNFCQTRIFPDYKFIIRVSVRWYQFFIIFWPQNCRNLLK